MTSGGIVLNQTQRSIPSFGGDHVDPTGKFILEGIDHYKALFSFSKCA
jgi:hypothetical protein